MAFNPSFAGSSGVENFYNNSVDFGSLYNAAATQDALERLNAIKREGSTFNNIIGADAKSIMEKYRMEGQQNLHDAQMFSKNLGTAAGFLSSGIGAAGKAGWFSGGGPGKMATLDSTPMTVENAYGSSVSYYDPNIYTDVGDVSSGHVFSPTSSWMTGG